MRLLLLAPNDKMTCVEREMFLSNVSDEERKSPLRSGRSSLYLIISLIAVGVSVGVGHGDQSRFQCRLQIVFAERRARS